MAATRSETLPAEAARLRVVHLGFKDHGWTRVMLQSLLAQGVRPVLMVEEESAMSKMKGGWYTSTLAESAPVPGPCVEQIEAANAAHPDLPPIQYELVSNHNDCGDLLAAAAPDIILFGTTRIIKPHILRLPSRGCLNCHPSLPGAYRGATTFIREILEDLPLGVMCHWATADLDLGDVVSSERIVVRRGDTLSAVVWALVRSAAAQFARAIAAIEDGSVSSTPQVPSPVPAFRWAEEELMERAAAKLRACEYKCYADDAAPPVESVALADGSGATRAVTV
jgi:folate-dependent phosphoribosylglycinamide formyltransferase PurN